MTAHANNDDEADVNPSSRTRSADHTDGVREGVDHPGAHIDSGDRPARDRPARDRPDTDAGIDSGSRMDDVPTGQVDVTPTGRERPRSEPGPADEPATESPRARRRRDPEADDVDESGDTAATAGAAPPPRLGRPLILQDVILGLDLSGQKFDAGLVNLRGQLLTRSSRPIEPDVGPQSHFANLISAVTEQMDEAQVNGCRVRAIGVACPGPVTPNCEQVSPLSIPAWRDFPLRRHLIELAGLPVYGDLDAKALALSEGWLGAAQGRTSFAAIMVSASIGGGLVIDGDLLDGANGNAGHIGHVIVDPGGRRCRCGARGCLDAEASGLAIEAITGRSTKEPTYDIMRLSGTLVGRAAAMVCNALDIDFVVVGGDVAEGFAATFMNAAQQEADRIGSARLGATPHISSTRLGSSGVLIGAGAVGIRGIRRHRARKAKTVESAARMAT